jgi:predicted dehydrogenase
MVGLGKLTLGQVLPALKTAAKYSKCVALVSGDPEKAKKVAAEYGVDPAKGIYNYQNYDTLKDNPEVDVVYVCLPNGMHAEYTVRAAKAGKHVLCEKPMANTAAECQQMIDACKTAKKQLMIAYRLHYEPMNLACIQMVRDKVMGAPAPDLADAGFNLQRNQSPWRFDKKLAGGGAMYDIGIYALNASRYLTGEEPAEVNAMMYTPKDDPRFDQVEDMITWQLKFPSGILTNSSTTYSTSIGNRFRVFGDQGFIEMEPFLNYGGLAGRKVLRGKPEPIQMEQINHFAAEFDHMSQCVTQDMPNTSPGDEGTQGPEGDRGDLRSRAKRKDRKTRVTATASCSRGACTASFCGAFHTSAQQVFCHYYCPSHNLCPPCGLSRDRRDTNLVVAPCCTLLRADSLITVTFRRVRRAPSLHANLPPRVRE